MTIIVNFIFCLLVYFAVSDGQQFRHDYHYDSDAGGWFKLHLIPAKWKEARLRCFNEGSVLASPENESLTAAMTRLIANQSCGVFTGIHSTFSKGYYSSVEGTPISKIPIRWAPGEPDNYEDNEDCLLMLTNGTMADVNCSDVFPYLCFKKGQAMPSPGCTEIDPNLVIIERKKCYIFYREPLVWPRAYAACDGKGGHLAIINSNDEAQIIKKLYAKSPEATMPGYFNKNTALIGFSDWDEHGSWVTIHGQTLLEAGYLKWNQKEPLNSTSTVFRNDTKGQYCGAVYRDGGLNDVWCDLPSPYICEFDF